MLHKRVAIAATRQTGRPVEPPRVAKPAATPIQSFHEACWKVSKMLRNESRAGTRAAIAVVKSATETLLVAEAQGAEQEIDRSRSRDDAGAVR